MTLTDARRFWVLMRDAGLAGIHTHEVRRLGVSGNPSQRAKDIVSKGVSISTARESRNGRPGSRFWLVEHAPDYAHPVKPNGSDLGGAAAPVAVAAEMSVAWVRDYTDPDGEWFEMSVEQLGLAA